LLTNLDTRLKQLLEQAARQGKSLDALREQVSSLTTQSDEVTVHLDTNVSTLAERLDTASVQLDTLGKRVSTLAVELDTLNSTVHRRVSSLRGQVSRQQDKLGREVISPSLSSGQSGQVRPMRTLDTATHRFSRSTCWQGEQFQSLTRDAKPCHAGIMWWGSMISFGFQSLTRDAKPSNLR